MTATQLRMTATQLAVTAVQLAATAIQLATIAAQLAVTAMQLAVTAVQLAVAATQLAVTAAQLAVTAIQLAVTATKRAVTASCVAVVQRSGGTTPTRLRAACKQIGDSAERRGEGRAGPRADGAALAAAWRIAGAIQRRREVVHATSRVTGQDPTLCERCGRGHLHWAGELAPQNAGRSPP